MIARANAVCAAEQRDIRGVTPPTGSSLSALATYLEQLVPIVDTEASRLRALPRPKQGVSLLDRWIESEQLAAADFRALRSAARLRDRAAIDTAFAALHTNNDEVLAQRYGARVCAASTGTVPGS